MLKSSLYNQKGKEIKKIDLDPDIFDAQVNQGVLYQSSLMYRANRRKGLASTKTRGEVSGGGVKPWRQKGTGRARVGSIRSPLWRGGGVVFGPHPRKYNFKLPKKIRINALKSSLNAKLNENNLLILDELKMDAPKTKQAAKLISDLKLHGQSTLLILKEIDDNINRSFRNIGLLALSKASDINAFDILKARKLVITLEGLKVLSERIKK